MVTVYAKTEKQTKRFMRRRSHTVALLLGALISINASAAGIFLPDNLLSPNKSKPTVVKPAAVKPTVVQPTAVKPAAPLAAPVVATPVAVPEAPASPEAPYSIQEEPAIGLDEPVQPAEVKPTLTAEVKPPPQPAEVKPPRPAAVKPPAQTEGSHFQVDVKNGSGLNLWTLPGGGSKPGNKKLGMIRNEAMIKQTGPAKGEWVPVEVGEHSGYVHRNYLDRISEAQYSEDCDGENCRAEDNFLVTLTNKLEQMVGSSKYQNPLPGFRWGGRNVGMHMHPIAGKLRYHAGQDIPAPRGTPVLAAREGVVVFSGESVGTKVVKNKQGRRVRVRDPKSGYGYLVVIKHPDGTTTRYGHVLYRGSCKATAKTGSAVSAGQQIGCVGSTGGSTGNHLHFEIRGKNDKPMQPSDLVKR